MTTNSTTTNTEKYNNDNDNHVVVLLRARTRERAFGNSIEKYKRELDAFADYWKLATGNTFPPAARRCFADALAWHYEPELLVEVIDQTSAAPRPSWAYCNAIMQRLFADEISTLAQYREAQAERLRSWGKYQTQI